MKEWIILDLNILSTMLSQVCCTMEASSLVVPTEQHNMVETKSQKHTRTCRVCVAQPGQGAEWQKQGLFVNF